MKILNIHFKNINSLAGENRLSFTQGPFADAGVFAITGANGSGKSSVLDAITLALYGETFRFDQPAEFVITQDSNEAYAEVEFKLGDAVYQSSWRAQRGEQTAITMQLLRVSDGEVLADTATGVCAAITELTGMNFRNFTRSMLLAQGDFSAFLNALDSERMTILETLIGSDIYTDARNDIINNADKAQQAVDKIKQELAAIKLLAPEELEAAEQDLADYQEQLNEYKAEKKQIEVQQLALKSTANLQIQVVDQKKRLQGLEKDWLANQESLDNIAVAKQALNFKTDLEALDDKQKTFQQHKKDWDALQNELEFLRGQLVGQADIPEQAGQLSFSEQHEAIDNIKLQINQARLDKQTQTALLQTLEAQAIEKKELLDSAEIWLNEHASDAMLVEKFPETAKLKKLRAELQALTGTYQQFTSSTKKTTASIKNTSSALTKTHATIAKLKEELVENEQARLALLPEQVETNGDPVQLLDNLKTSQQDRVKQFEQLCRLAENYQRVNPQQGGWFGWFGSKPLVDINIEALEQEREELRDMLKREENIKRALEEAVYREALMKKLSVERPHLAEGKPCPLCGSKQHPYLTHAPVLGNSVQALADQKINMLQLNGKVEQLGRRIVSAQKETDKNRATRQQLQAIKAEWTTQCNRLNVVSDELDIDNLSLMKSWLKEAESDLKNILLLIGQYQKRTANIAKINALIVKNQAAIGDLQETAVQLDQSTQGVSQEQQDLEAALAQLRQEEQALSETVLAQLAALGEAMPGKGKEDAFFDRLNVRRQDYQTQFLRKQALLAELTESTTQQATCQQEIGRCDQLINTLMQQLQGEELIGVHLALIEKQQLIAEKDRVLSEQENQFKHMQQTLQEALAASPFANFTELRNALQFLQREPEFTQRASQLQQQMESRKEELAQMAAQLETDFMVAENAPSTDDLYRELKQVVNKMDIAQSESQRLQNRLAQQTQARQQFDKLSVSLKQKEQEAVPFLAEKQLLDSENGMVFRRRVQVRIAEQLLAKTNRILEKISGRYYLRFNPEPAGLALEIEDTLQNNVRRQPKTLSGGESFIVSLALALGLSELANNNKSVDSLFIDEGFGNLDGDSLTLVLSTLENLRAYGKTVGVISHVDAVKKRIKTQVQVVKKNNGFSLLKQAS